MEDEKRAPLEESSDGSFSSEDCEVVRSQFFSQSSEPAVTFGRRKMWVNSVCLTKFPQTDHVRILINRGAKTLALYPSREDDRNSLPWCFSNGEKRKPRQLSCPMFFAKIYALMEWSPSCRYRAAGKHLRGSRGELLAFDLRAAEAYAYSADTTQRYIPRFPVDWRDQFGVPVAEHGLEPLVHMFDEYAVFELEPPEPASDTPERRKSEGGE